MSEKPKNKKQKSDRSNSGSPKSRKSSTGSKKSRKSSPSSPVPKEKLQEVTASANNCLAHSKPFTYYNELKEEPLCEDCVKSPQQSSFQNKVLPIEHAYRNRLSSIYQLLNSKLIPKREFLKAQMRKTEFALEDFNRTKQAIERDIKSEFCAMNERLNAAHGSKVALLTHSIKGIKEDLVRINEVSEKLEKSGEDMVGFMTNFRQLEESLDLSLNKPVGGAAEVSPQDLPRELEEVRTILENYSALEGLNACKNQIIWKLLSQTSKHTPFEEPAQKEIAEWAKLTGNYAKQLFKYQMVCDFCGVTLDEKSVNTECLRNTQFSYFYKNLSAPEEAKKTGRHYFLKQT